MDKHDEVKRMICEMNVKVVCILEGLFMVPLTETVKLYLL